MTQDAQFFDTDPYVFNSKIKKIPTNCDIMKIFVDELCVISTKDMRSKKIYKNSFATYLPNYFG